MKIGLLLVCRLSRPYMPSWKGLGLGESVNPVSEVGSEQDKLLDQVFCRGEGSMGE